MNLNKLITMALEAHLFDDDQESYLQHLQYFASLVAAAEREACANVAKAISDKYAFGYYGQEVDTADEIEAAIRARGTP